MKGILVTLLVISVLVIAGCGQVQQNQTQTPVCNKPYILVGTECCLDQNDNAICDKDEKVQESSVEKIVEQKASETSEEPKIVCGNKNCDANETKYTCPEDCGKPYSVDDLKNTIRAVYGDDITFTSGKVKINKYYNGTSLEYVSLYDSMYATIIEIKDSGLFVDSGENFKEFVETFEKSQRNIPSRSDAVDEQGRPLYEFESHTSSDFIPDSNNNLIDYRYWAKVYEIKYGDGTSGKHKTTPTGRAYIYLRCTPNLIVVVYANDYGGIGSVWSSLTDEQYDDNLHDSLETEHDDALQEAEDLFNSCPK